MWFESNAKENFCTIDGKQYATGENGKGLYELVDPAIAYFPGETILINSNFELQENSDVEREMRKAIKKAKI